MEELIGRVDGELWLAASACPYGSSILRILSGGFLYAASKVLEKGMRDRSRWMKPIKSNQTQVLAEQMLVTIRPSAALLRSLLRSL